MSLKKIQAAIDLLEEKKRLFPDQAGHFDDVLSVLQEKDAVTALTEEAEKLGLYSMPFPILRRAEPPKLTEEEVQAKMAELRASNSSISSDLPCMRRREGCSQPRMGDSVLCEAHTEEVLRGERRAPPLRQNIDYIATGRKTFLVEQLPEELPKSEKKVECAAKCGVSLHEVEGSEDGWLPLCQSCRDLGRAWWFDEGHYNGSWGRVRHPNQNFGKNPSGEDS